MAGDGIIRPHHNKFLALVRLLDVAVVLGSLWLITRYWSIFWYPQYSSLGIYATLLMVFFSEYFELYSTWRGSPMRREAGRILVVWFCVIVVMLVVGYFFNAYDQYSVDILAVWAVVTPFGLILLHGFRRVVLGQLRSFGFNTRKIAIVGANDLGVRLLSAFGTMPWLGYRLKGYYDDRAERKNRRLSGSDIRMQGDFERVYQDAREGEIDILFVALPLCAEHRTRQLIERLADTTVSVYIIPDLYAFNLLHSRWTTYQGIPAVSVYDTPFYMFNGTLKRVEDIVLSVLALVVLFVPMLLIAFIIKLTSGGSVLFQQKRYGIRGEDMMVWKFRTMDVCENGNDVQQATRNDPRVTSFGAFLRRTSLDELPQFFNVLQGRMSVVGPRPHAVAHNEYYRSRVQGYMLRHKVKPGITGLAQVSGYRGETETLDKMEARVRSDLNYINHWSLLLDLKILLLTVVNGFTGEKAY